MEIEEKNSFKLNNVKQTLMNWIEETTAHGIPRIVHSNNTYIKVMWTFFILLSFGYCLSTMIKSIIEYTKYETLAQITVERNSPTEFPAITICNLNPYNYKANIVYMDRDIDSLLRENGLNDIDWNQFKNTDTCRELLDDYLLKIKRVVSNKYKNDKDKRYSIGFYLETMMLSCTFNKIQCNAKEFSYFWNNEYGNCYTFNNGRNIFNQNQTVYDTSLSGSSFGFQLELLIGDPLSQRNFAIKNGISLIVHNKSTPIEMLTEGINVPTGQDTYVTVTRTFSNKLSNPYSNCIDDLEKYNSLSEYSKKVYAYMKQLNITDYYQELCYKLCFQDQLINECNCGELNIPLIKDVNYCQNDTELSCLENVNKRFSQSTYEKECKYSCPIQCSTIKYDLSSHAASYPSSFYYEKLIKSLNQLPPDSEPFEILKDFLKPTQITSDEIWMQQQIQQQQIIQQQIPFARQKQMNKTTNLINNISDSDLEKKNGKVFEAPEVKMPYSKGSGMMPQYNTEIQMSKIISSRLDQIEKDQNINRLRENIVKITVNYNDLTYTVVHETPSMSLDTLLGILGGQLGLFIGISLLSLIEVFELIINIIIAYNKSRDKDKKTDIP